MTLRESIASMMLEHTRPTTGKISPSGVRLISAIIFNDYGVCSIPPSEYDAILVSTFDAEEGQPMWGYIFGDKMTTGNHPFLDGTGIHTSRVKSFASPTDELKLVKTNNTTYLVI